MGQIKKIIKKTLKLAGLNVSKTPTTPPPLLYHEIGLLLDVGANIGQYAAGAREIGFRNKIVSFEPLSEAYKTLVERSKGDKNWIVHERCALGSKVIEAEINISKNLQSSSLLRMLPAHLNAAPDSVYIGKEVIKIVTIDSIYPMYSGNNECVFLKIDAQGYEKEILEGAKNSLRHIKGVQLELSVLPLYEGQSSYDYFFKLFRECGFVLWSVVPGFTDPKTGQLLQFDAVFVR